MKYQRFATNELNKISDQRWKVIALLASKKPIAIASNDLEKTHPLAHKFNPNRRSHAEIRCLRKAPKSKTANSVMYIWRYGKNGELALSKPCEMCMAILRNFEVKKVIYSTSSGFIAMRI